MTTPDDLYSPGPDDENAWQPDAIGPFTASGPVGLGGSASLGVVPSLSAIPEVAVAGGIHGSVIIPGTLDPLALSSALPSGSVVTWGPVPPSSPVIGDVWHQTDAAVPPDVVTSSDVTDINTGETTTTVTTTPGIPAPGNVITTSAWDGTQWVPYPIGPGAVAFSAVDIGGVQVFVQDTAPAGIIADGSLWYDTAHGMQLNVSAAGAWAAYQFAAGAIETGSLTAAQIQAGSISAQEIQAGTITAQQISANTISANELIAGLVVAGIVDATTINAATFNGSVFNGSVFNGSDFVLSTAGAFFYSSAPAANKLTSSITNATGTDSYGNQYLSGITSYGYDPGTSSYYATQQDTTGVSFYVGGATQSVAYTFSSAVAIQLYSTGPGVSGNLDIVGNVLITGSLVTTGGTPASQTFITTDIWNAITLDAGWSLNASYAAPSYRLLPDGNLQLTGLADFGSSATANHNLNNGHPLPAQYRPQSTKVFRVRDPLTGRGAVQVNSGGVIQMLASATYPAQYCEIDTVLTLSA